MVADPRVEAAKLLTRSAELVRGGWCKGMDAKAKDGTGVLPADPTAVLFDARGAMRRAAHEIGAGPDVVKEAERWLNEALVPGMTDPAKYGRLSVVGWNDHGGQTQAAVVKGFERAAELAGKHT
jgi:hypothetical protein